MVIDGWGANPVAEIHEKSSKKWWVLFRAEFFLA